MLIGRLGPVPDEDAVPAPLVVAEEREEDPGTENLLDQRVAWVPGGEPTRQQRPATGFNCTTVNIYLILIRMLI